MLNFKKYCIPDTLEYISYADEDQNETIFADLVEEITPEGGDEYVHGKDAFLWKSDNA